jgi:hypothetical protein
MVNIDTRNRKDSGKSANPLNVILQRHKKQRQQRTVRDQQWQSSRSEHSLSMKIVYRSAVKSIKCSWFKKNTSM